MITLRGVGKTYGEGAAQVDALKSIDLHVPAGEFVSIMGPSGSGKSTLLNLVSALDLPSSGWSSPGLVDNLYAASPRDIKLNRSSNSIGLT